MILPTVKRPSCIHCVYWYGPPALVAFAQGPEAKHFCPKQGRTTTRDIECIFFTEGLREPDPEHPFCSDCGARLSEPPKQIPRVTTQEVTLQKTCCFGLFSGEVILRIPVFSTSERCLCAWCRTQTSEDEK